MIKLVTPETVTMAPLQDHHLQDSNLTSQAMLVPTLLMVSTVTTLNSNSTQEAEHLLAQVEASGPEWGQEGCWGTSLVVRELSPTITATPLTPPADIPLLETPPPLLLGHALLQVLEEPREDRSCGWHRLSSKTNIQFELQAEVLVIGRKWHHFQTVIELISFLLLKKTISPGTHHLWILLVILS